MRMILSAGLMIAIACSLLGCATPAQVQSAPVQRAQYPASLVLPSDVMSLVL
jgi:hypothetical protein